MVKNLKKVKSVDEYATSLLHNVYCWKAYYLIDMNGLLVLVSNATARAFYVVKVRPIRILLAIFGFVSENARFLSLF